MQINNGTRVWILGASLKIRAEIRQCVALMEIDADDFEAVADLPIYASGPVLLLIEEQIALSAAFASYLASLSDALSFIVLSAEPNWQSAVAAMRANALDYLPWPCDRRTLLAAIRQAGADSTVSVHQRQRRDVARQRLERLSKREREVLSGVTRGMTNKTIASALGISHRTVDVHRANVIHKLMVHNTPEAIKVALDAGLSG